MSQIITYNCDCCKKICDRAYKLTLFHRNLDICMKCGHMYSIEFIIRAVWPTGAEQRQMTESQ